MATGSNDTSETQGAAAPKIQIRFFGAIRVVAGKIDDELDHIPDTTVSGLLGLLSEKYGKALRDELFLDNGSGGLRDDLMITVNEAIINHEKASQIEVNRGDIISLFPTFPGGG